MLNLVFREAVASDAAVLTDIAFAAKRVWGYPEEWIGQWAEELTVRIEYIERNWVLIARADGRVPAWCAVFDMRKEFWLDHCWVSPEFGGRGIGRALVEKAFAHAARSHAIRLKVISDPNACEFYRKPGFQTIGRHPSKPGGRFLPILEADLANTGDHHATTAGYAGD